MLNVQPRDRFSLFSAVRYGTNFHPEEGHSAEMKILAKSIATNIRLRPGPVVVPLMSAVPLSISAVTTSRDRHVYLLLKGVRAAKQPGVLFHLFLDAPPGPPPGDNDPRQLAVLNFFNVVPPTGLPIRNAGRDISYDITQRLQLMKDNDLLTERTTVTIISTGQFPRDAYPMLRRIEIAEQSTF
jgi:hypothetical protein